MGFHEDLFGTNAPCCPYCDAPVAEIEAEHETKQHASFSFPAAVLLGLLGVAMLVWASAQTPADAKSDSARVAGNVGMYLFFGLLMLASRKTTVTIPNRCRRCDGTWGRVAGLTADRLQQRVENAKHFFERGAHGEALHHLDRLVEIGQQHGLAMTTAGFGSLHLMRGLCQLDLGKYTDAQATCRMALALLEPNSQEYLKAREYLVVIDGALVERRVNIDWGLVRKDAAELLVSGIMRVLWQWTGKDERYVVPGPDASRRRHAEEQSPRTRIASTCCDACGRRVADEVKFCEGCGRSVVRGGDATPNAEGTRSAGGVERERRRRFSFENSV